MANKISVKNFARMLDFAQASEVMRGLEPLGLVQDDPKLVKYSEEFLLCKEYQTKVGLSYKKDKHLGRPFFVQGPEDNNLAYFKYLFEHHLQPITPSAKPSNKLR